MRFFSRHMGIVIGFLVAVVLFNGCATIFSGSKNDVSFSSDPSGASIYIDGMLMGKTPLLIELSKKREHHVEFRLEGYEPGPRLITHSVGAGWVILDVLFGGLIGIVVDAVTGSWYSLDDHHVHATLEKK